MPLAGDAEADTLIDLDGPAIDGIDPETGVGRAAAALVPGKGNSRPHEILAQTLAGQIGPQIDLDRQQPLGFLDLEDPCIAARIIEGRKDPVRPTRGIHLGEVIGVLGVMAVDFVEAVIGPAHALRGIVDGHRDEAELQDSSPVRITPPEAPAGSPRRA